LTAQTGATRIPYRRIYATYGAAFTPARIYSMTSSALARTAVQTERARGLQVDDPDERAGPLNRKVLNSSPFEDPINIGCTTRGPESASSKLSIAGAGQPKRSE
jgi:hypothetical protein